MYPKRKICAFNVEISSIILDISPHRVFLMFPVSEVCGVAAFILFPKYNCVLSYQVGITTKSFLKCKRHQLVNRSRQTEMSRLGGKVIFAVQSPLFHLLEVLPLVIEGLCLQLTQNYPNSSVKTPQWCLKTRSKSSATMSPFVCLSLCPPICEFR